MEQWGVRIYALSYRKRSSLIGISLECCADRSLCHPRGCSPERKLFFGRHCRPFLWAPKNRRRITISINCANVCCVLGEYAPPMMWRMPRWRLLLSSPSGWTVLASLLVRAAINFLKLPMGLPLQSVKQIEGCSEIQHLRYCGSDVCSNSGPARWNRPVQAVHLNGGILAA